MLAPSFLVKGNVFSSFLVVEVSLILVGRYLRLEPDREQDCNLFWKSILVDRNPFPLGIFFVLSWGSVLKGQD
jgi:hypothetical protein